MPASTSCGHQVGLSHATTLNAILSFLPSSPQQAIQYVQSHPDEVCPAGWKPGDKTMNPSPKKSKDYFKAI